MGSYLSKPLTEKVSNDETLNNVSYGASCMQGWRISQEDAHNAILNYDDSLSLFAVYDGHGGEEVAVYTADQFPDHLKMKIKEQEKEDYSNALKKTFLDFDEKLVQPEILKIIQDLAKDSSGSDTEHYEEELEALRSEATMPIEKLIQKYTERIYKQKKISEVDVKEKPSSSGVISSTDAEANSSLEDCSTNEGGSSPEEDKVASADNPSDAEKPALPCQESENIHNGDTCGKDNVEEDISKSTDTKDSVINGDTVVKKGKGKGHSKGKNVLSAQELEEMKRSQTTRLRRTLTRAKSGMSSWLHPKIIESGHELSDDSDDDSDSEDDSDVQIGEETGEEDEECSDEIEDEDSSENDDAEEEESDGENVYSEFLQQNMEEPCYDSGCTACVALLKERHLYVANVGDSRCVVYRKGQAVDMSVDHKPEDLPEFTRIIKAGGKITDDGRVNGGLNLSRALGDHRYKQNKVLKPEEQMISPEPDIQTLELTDKDSFMVIACDGIWNSMTSQQVCEFVDSHIKQQTKLSSICEKLFDECLAPNTEGDGTGCDNMTCIIVQFSFPNEQKRRLDEGSETTKKPKIDLS